MSHVAERPVFVVFVICERQGCGSACASEQSDCALVFANYLSSLLVCMHDWAVHLLSSSGFR